MACCVGKEKSGRKSGSFTLSAAVAIKYEKKKRMVVIRMIIECQQHNVPQQRPRATGTICKQGGSAGSAACGWLSDGFMILLFSQTSKCDEADERHTIE